MLSPQRSGDDGKTGSGSGRKHRRSTSDITAMIKDGKRWPFATAFATTKKPINADTNNLPGYSPSSSDPNAAYTVNQLNENALKIKIAARIVNHVDSTWNDYINHRDKCFECCKTLMSALAQKRQSALASSSALPPSQFYFPRDSSLDSLNSIAVEICSPTQSSGNRASSSLRLAPYSDQYQKAAREWGSAVELLANTMRTSLEDTYNRYYETPTSEGFEKICTDKGARLHVIFRMRNTSISEMVSTDPDFFPKYDLRFRNYDEIQMDLDNLHSLLSTSNIPQNRTIIERRISPTGDAMLEFVNAENERHPVFRFRVSSHCLRETSSPIFRHMFNSNLVAELDEDDKRGLPLPPTLHVCSDGTEVMLYRMPQIELNIESSLEILLHAAHNHNDKVPREVQFSRFVAIAKACLRYQCTSPLELAVEHMWLPYWRENATDDMLGEVLLISYVFGLSENFTHLSRIAILEMGSQNFTPCRSWPYKVKQMIESIRRAKIEQVYEICRMTLNEYLNPSPTATNPTLSDTDAERSTQGAQPSSALRCPRGDRACEAQNLGWYMKSLAELDLLSAVLPSPALFSHHQQMATPLNKTSLRQIIDALGRITSPPNQTHGGVCDFAPMFRAAVEDVRESLVGLTLFEVSGGKKHGWALSGSAGGSSRRNGPAARNSRNSGGGSSSSSEQLFDIAQNYPSSEVQSTQPTNHRRNHTSFLSDGSYHVEEVKRDEYQDDDESRGEDACFFKILSMLDDPRDLRAAALINRRFYRTYLRNKARLLQGLGLGQQPSEEGEYHLGKDPVEVDSTPRVPPSVRLSSSNTSDRSDQLLIPPIVVENKRLLDGDVNEKFEGGMRERLRGIPIPIPSLGPESPRNFF